MTNQVTADDLITAVLAMDTYSRGNNPFWLRAPQLGDRPGLGQMVGDATVIGQSDGNRILGLGDTIVGTLPNDTSSDGFSATAYSYKGKIVISYRGTVSDTWTVYLQDVLNGWAAGTGLYTTQLADAIAFYKAFAGDQFASSPSNIVVTGQSLGGGLAGYIADLYGISGTVIDNMPFEVAALSTYALATQDTPDPMDPNTTIPPDPALKAFVYGSGSPFAPLETLGLNAFAIQGESLTALRFGQALDVDYLDVTGTGPLAAPNAGLGADQLHSPSLMVIRMFADVSALGKTNWQGASNYVFPALYDNNPAIALGIGGTDANGSPLPTPYGTRNPSELLRAIIAYTAVGANGFSETAGAPFGTTGLASFYHDAGILGDFLQKGLPKSLTAILPGSLRGNYTTGETADGIVSALADIAVQYAGDQAIFAARDASYTSGAFAQDEQKLSITIDPAKWNTTYLGGEGLSATKSIIGAELFALQLFGAYGSSPYSDLTSTKAGQALLDTLG